MLGDFIAPRRAYPHWSKSGSEIAVVVRKFLRAHRLVRPAVHPQTRFLVILPRFEHPRFGVRFRIERVLQVANDIQFFTSVSCRIFRRRAHADVGVAAQQPSFHIAVAHFGIKQDLLERVSSVRLVGERKSGSETISASGVHRGCSPHSFFRPSPEILMQFFAGRLRDAALMPIRFGLASCSISSHLPMRGQLYMEI